MILRSRAWWRYTVAGLLAALIGLATRVQPPDLVDFGAAGQRLLDGHLDGVYESGWNQAGPVQLLAGRLLLIGGSDGMPAAVTVAAVNAVLMIAALRLCRRTAGDDPLREAVTALLTLLWLAVPVVWDGHPAELAVPVVWAYATELHRSRRPIAAAFVLGLGVAIAPWAVLGFPCLLAAGPVRRAAGTAALGAAVGAAAYLPFVVSGNFGMFGHVWPVGAGTLAALAGLDEVTWPVRLAQAVVVAGGCAAIAHVLRDRALVVAGAPAAAALLRVATDPVVQRYYWAPVAVTTVLLLAMTPPDRTSTPPHGTTTPPRGTTSWLPDRRWWPAALLGYLALLAAGTSRPLPGAAACLVVLIVTLTRAEHRRLTRAHAR